MSNDEQQTGGEDVRHAQHLVEELDASVKEALALTELRVRVEALQQENDVKFQRMAQLGTPATRDSITGVRLHVLCETLLGDMDSGPRLAYELAVQQAFAKDIDAVSSQAAQSKLLQGVRIDPKHNKLPPNGLPQ